MAVLTTKERKARHKEACRIWSANNPDKMREYYKRNNAKRRVQQIAWGKNRWRTFYCQPANRMRKLFSKAASRARQAGFEYDESVLTQLTSNPPERCACCNELLEFAPDKAGVVNRRPSLDRVDNTKGYTESNVQTICYRCNRLKNDGTADEHERIAQYIRRYTQ